MKLKGKENRLDIYAPPNVVEQFDKKWRNEGIYNSRSEAVRGLMRKYVEGA